jgi:hypothetical protein
VDPHEDSNEFSDPIKIWEASGLAEKQLAAEEGLWSLGVNYLFFVYKELNDFQTNMDISKC